MRKLLLLLPLMALASCSGGHDLMSNEPFRMTCEPNKEEDGFVAVVSPELPQATVNTGELQFTFDLSVVAPTRLRLDRLQGPYGDAIVIERETGQVSWGLFNLPNRGLFGQKPYQCTFETL